MKSALVILFLAAAVIPTLSQKTPPCPPEKHVSLTLGSVTVWLGMPQAHAMGAFSSAGYKAVEDMKENSYRIINGIGPNQRTYAVQFKSGVLTYADRTWSDPEKNTYEAILGALQAVDGRQCKVSHQPMHTPDMNVDRMFLICNSRTIFIDYGSLRGESGRNGNIIERIEAQ